MKLLKSKKLRNYFLRFIATAVVIVIISCSMTIDTIVQPSTINAGDPLNATLNIHVTTNSAQTSRLVIAILVPKAWNARSRATLSFVSDITTGPQQMAPIAPGVPAPNSSGLDWATHLASKIGNGGNLINDWEWIAFASNAAYPLGSNADVTATVSVSIPTSLDNISFRMGYAIANSTDGLSGSEYYGSFLNTGCLRVVGSGDLVDFCNPQLSSVEPRIALDNDIITLGFDAGVTANPLEAVNDIYLCATAVTTTGQRIDVCTPGPQTKITSLGAGRYRMDLWPRKYFNLTDAQKLTRIEYFFTNASGSVKVGYGGGEDPFLFTFSCK